MDLSFPAISINIVITVAIAASCAALVHWKSHVKYIGLGQFVGMVLAQTVATPLYQFLAERFDAFNNLSAVNYMQLALLLIPTVVLGINHAHDKRRMNPIKMVAYMVTVTLSLLANILAYLPEATRQYIVERSFLALQLYYYRVPIVVAMAVLIVIDSFSHKKSALADKKAPKGKK